MKRLMNDEAIMSDEDELIPQRDGILCTGQIEKQGKAEGPSKDRMGTGIFSFPVEGGKYPRPHVNLPGPFLRGLVSRFLLEDPGGRE